MFKMYLTVVSNILEDIPSQEYIVLNANRFLYMSVQCQVIRHLIQRLNIMRIVLLMTIPLVGHLVTPSHAEYDDLRQEIILLKTAFHQKTEEINKQMFIFRKQIARLEKENQQKNKGKLQFLIAFKILLIKVMYYMRSYYHYTLFQNSLHYRRSFTRFLQLSKIIMCKQGTKASVSPRTHIHCTCMIRGLYYLVAYGDFASFHLSMISLTKLL